MSDLVKRLRDWCVNIRRKPAPISDAVPMVQQAADRIEALEAVLRQAREAIMQLVACHDEPSCPAIEIGEHYIASIDEALK